MKTRRSHSNPLALTLGLTTIAMLSASACDKKEDPPSTAQARPVDGSPDPAGAATPPHPSAAPSPNEPAAPGAHEGAGEVSDEQLDKFADAFSGVQELQSSVEKDLSTAKSPEDAQQVQQRASQEAAAIVTKAGLSMSEYTQIAQRIQGDEDLRDRLEEKVQAR